MVSCARVRHAPVGPIRVPTLFIWGDQDDTVGRAAAEGTGEFNRHSTNVSGLRLAPPAVASVVTSPDTRARAFVGRMLPDGCDQGHDRLPGERGDYSPWRRSR